MLLMILFVYGQKGAQDRMGNNTMSKNEKLFIHNSQASKFAFSLNQIYI